MSFNFMAAVTIYSDFRAPQNKVCHYFHCFPIYLSLSDGTGCHDLSFLNVELFFKFKFIYFNWRLITLQYCIGFAIHQHESAMGVHVFPILNPPPPPSPYHPSGSSQCISPEHSVSCIKPGLAIRFTYDNIRFNAILPNHPTLTLSHRVQKTVLYICVCFAVSHTGLSLPSF